ncbi:acetate/propionate family kinase [Gemmatimonas phototrophica]|uniref:Acetate kinase n=1 Tax=Gemmatimonas phototrophica TaxID=1379270 RepID=A0A143BLB9_9BACT|nr:acetate kinase [Gemmatimonas phototrophica]AMW05254.1 acetate kinase [Gemmatimonas phototrophica]
MNVLVLNVGSATLKFQVVVTDNDRIMHDQDVKLLRGQIERIGGESVITLRGNDGSTRKRTAPLRDMRSAVDWLVGYITDPESGTGLTARGDIHAVGHRVVHGGEQFRASVLVDESVLQGIEDNVELAPLHNPHNLRGIEATRKALGSGVPQVAVFDTAFHHTLPEHAYLYAIPYPLYRRHKIRRYGFHGTSHRSIAYRFRKITDRERSDVRIVTLHLGNGCSACAIRGGVSIDTSMGFTPLEGLVMGTRSGDIDAALLDYIAAKEGLSLSQVEAMLNSQSGLLGISGLTNDMRDLLAEANELQDRRARLAIEIFCYRARKYVGAYLAALGGADAVVFAGGVGENSAQIRARICDGLEWAGLRVDAAANESLVGGREGRFSAEGSSMEAWVVPTDEELLIARDTFRVVSGAPLPS